MRRRVLLVLGLLLALGCGLALRFVEVEVSGVRMPLHMLLTFAGSVALNPLFGPKPAEGLRIDVWSEHELESVPVAIDVDGRGRVWVAESPRIDRGVSDNRFKPYWLLDDLASKTVADRQAYIEKWSQHGGDPLEWYTETADRVRVVEDADGDGSADSTRVVGGDFRGVTTGLGAGVLAHGSELYYTNIPDLWRLRDSDGDGTPDQRELLATGFGVRTSLLGHDMHGLALGPEGRIYFSIGDRGYDVVTREGRHLFDPMDAGRGAVFRLWPDGSGLEVFATGLRNPQELAFDDFGNLFTGDNNGDGGDLARVVYVAEGGDSGWSEAYQSLEGDYLRGPWNAERLWELAHPGQPAWILPPVAYLAKGPAGFKAYPGTGLPARYADHFFLADYSYANLESGIWSFALKPAGAGFAMEDVHEFVWGILATDLAFGPDGRFFVSRFQQFPSMEQQLYAGRHEVARDDPRVAEVARHLREGGAALPEAKLLRLLGHADRRLRQLAQAELVSRRRADLLGQVAADASAPLLARVHALFGLEALGAGAIRSLGWSDFRSAAGGDPRLLAVALRVAGDAGCGWLAPGIAAELRNSDPRVAYAAAQALGALGTRSAVPALFDLLRADSDRDVFIRHAVVYALARIGDLDAVFSRADDASSAVRMGVLLVLRRARDARLARFLGDPEPQLVVEAARAIHDLRIEAALPALAALAGEAALPLEGEDPETSYALQRRAIDANLILGGAAEADRLGRHARSSAHPIEMRRAALAALEEFAAPGPRDPVNGYARALAPRDPERLHAALDRHLPQLLRGDLAAEAFRVALRYDRMQLSDGELAVEAGRFWLSDEIRAASLRALARRGSPGHIGPVLESALRAGLASFSPALRSEARDALVSLDPEAALAALGAVDWRVGWRAPASERQRALAALARLASPGADALLAARLDALTSGELAPELALDTLDAARARDSAPLRERLARYEASLDPRDPLAAYRVALAGGDPGRGQALFEGSADCLRCHAVGGHGGQVGPDLSAVGGREPRYLLESLVDPQAQLAPGFRSVSVTTVNGERYSGDLEEETDSLLRVRSAEGLHEIRKSDVKEKLGPASGMPPLGRSLPLRDLRDVVAYLESRK